MTGRDEGLPPIIVLGAGGHAGVLIQVLRRLDRAVLFATAAPDADAPDRVGGVDVRSDEDVLRMAPESVELANGVGSARLPVRRMEVYGRFRALGYRFTRVIHPQAIVEESAKLGPGAQVMAGAVIQHNAVLGEDTLVNTRASIGHDARVGDHVHVAPGGTVCGEVSVGAGSHLGAGATVIQGVRIGESCLVGAGAVVTDSVPDGVTALGIPARPYPQGAPA